MTGLVRNTPPQRRMVHAGSIPARRTTPNLGLMTGGNMTQFSCWDDDCREEVTIDSDTSLAAAREYLRECYGPAETHTIILRIYTRAHDGATDAHTITLVPDAPPCSGASHAHHWRHKSVVANGGGVIEQDECRVCNLVCETDTWAQDPATGEQGLTTVTYIDALSLG